MELWVTIHISKLECEILELQTQILDEGMDIYDLGRMVVACMLGPETT